MTGLSDVDAGGREYRVTVSGQVQGLVIGDHNTVTQHFHTDPATLPTPREAPVLYDPVVGRDGLLERLGSALTTGASPRIAALCGMGGIGKSTLAALFAGSDSAVQAFPDGTFWIDLRDGDPMDALEHMARAFGRSVEAHTTLEGRSRAVRSVTAERRILVVADDARTEDEVLVFLPAHPLAAVIVTTRDEAVAAALTERLVPVDRLEAKAGVALLTQLAGGGPPGTDGPDPELVALVEDLGGLPLALELVGKQARREARRPGFSWAALRGRYARPDARLDLARGDRGVRAAFERTWSHSLDESGRRHFALLGIFPTAEFFTGEVAAAWNENPDRAHAALGELLDLSLVRQVDDVTLRLHPLLKDYAEEKAAGVLEAERTEAHLRISDYHHQRAPTNPATWRDIQPVLLSHHHAVQANDRERARRVFPWFGSVPVPGFLLDRGFVTARIHHLGLDLALSRDEGPVHHAYATFWYANALGEARRYHEAARELENALGLIAGLPDQKAPVVPAARGKFSYRLGQIHAESGNLDAALAAYRTALADDRAQGHDTHALVTLMQMGDLWLKRIPAPGDAPEPSAPRHGSGPTGEGPGPDDAVDPEEQAMALFQEARDLAHKGGHLAEEAMALARLADRLKRADPTAALELIRDALRLDQPQAHGISASPGSTSAFASRQGARYAIYLGRIAAELLPTLPQALEPAVTAYTIALHRSGAADAVVHHTEALYWFGHLFEHLFLVPGLAPEYPAAAACYLEATRLIESMEAPPPIHPRERLETRIVPRLEPGALEALIREVEVHPLAPVQEAVDRLVAGLPPSPTG